MENSREDVRKLLRYEFLMGHGAREASRNINLAYGNGTVGKSTACDWFKKFKHGEMQVVDQPRSGRPQVLDRNAILAAIEVDPSMSTRLLSVDFFCSVRQIERVFRAAGESPVFVVH